MEVGLAGGSAGEPTLLMWESRINHSQLQSHFFTNINANKSASFLFKSWQQLAAYVSHNIVEGTYPSTMFQRQLSHTGNMLCCCVGEKKGPKTAAL